MDTERMYEAFQATYTAMDASVRKQAEDYIMGASKQPGAAQAFYEIAVAQHVPVPVRQAASIRLKYLVKRRDWNAAETTVSPAERAMIKSTLLDAISHSPERVQRQLSVIMMAVIEYDFPHNWDELPTQIDASLKSQDNSKISGALLAIRKICKRYESIAAGSERRAEVEAFARTFFPTLLQIFKAVNASSALQTPANAYIQKLLLKCFYSTNNQKLLQFLLATPDLLEGWFTEILCVFKQPVDCTPGNDIQVAWRTKKWVGYIMARMLMKYGKKKNLNGKKEVKKQEVAFHTKLVGTYAAPFIESSIEMLVANRPEVYEADPSKETPDRKSICRIIDILYSASDIKKLLKLLAQHQSELLQNALFPLLYYSRDDLELWQNNPQEYIRVAHCSYKEDFSNPKVFAVNLIMALASTSASGTSDELPPAVLAGFLAFLNNVLQETLPHSGDFNAMRKRYAAFHVVGALKSVLLRHEAFSANLETVVSQHVFPMFQSQMGFMRASAVMTMSRYAKLKWTNEENFKTALSANLNLLNDPELPVRIEAGLALQKMIATSAARDLVKPMLGQIVEKCFTLMDEIDADQLVMTLEVVVGAYGEELTEQAIQITTGLLQHFSRIVSGIKLDVGGAEDDFANLDEDDAFAAHDEQMTQISAADQCLTAVGQLGMSLKDKPETLHGMFTVALPVLEQLFSDVKYYEFFDTACNLTNVFTGYSLVLPPPTWRIFDLLNNAFRTYAQDSVKKALAPFDNFISKDCASFLRDAPRVHLFGEFCQFVLEHNQMSWSEKSVVGELMHVLIQYAKPHGPLLSPDLLASFYDITLKALSAPKDPPQGKSKVVLVNVLVNGLYCNAPLTIAYLESKGVAELFFKQCLNLVPSYPADDRNVIESDRYHRPRDMKVAVLGFTAVLSGPRPSCITDEMALQMSEAVLQMSIEIWQICEEQDDELDEETGSVDEMALGGLDGDSDDDEFPEDDEGDLPELCMQAQAMARAQMEEDYFYDEEDAGAVWSIIDRVNEALVAKNYLTSLQQQAPQAFQMLAAKPMNADALKQLEPAVAYGEKSVEEAAKQLHQ